MFQTVMKYTGAYKKYTFFATILITLAVIVSIVPFFLTYQVIDQLLLGTVVTFRATLPSIILVAICLALNAVLYIYGLKLSHIAAFNTLFNLRKHVQSKLEVLPLGSVQDKGVGAIKKIIVDDIENVEMLLAHGIPEGIANLLTPLLVFIAMFFVDYRLALLTIGSLPLGILCMAMMMKVGFARMDAYYASSKVMNSTIVEYINGMEVIKIFNKEGSSYQKFSDDVKNYKTFTLDWFKACRGWQSMYGIVFATTTFLTLPFGVWLVVAESVTISQLLLVLCLGFSISGALIKAVNFVPALAQVAKKIEEIENALMEEPLKHTEDTFKGKKHTVDFSQVTFAYKDTEVIKDVSFTIKEGTKTALVGESGSGKSTLAKLLVHFYDAKEGTIKIGGQNIQEMSIKALNEKVSFVSQDQFLFNTSIYENIKIGNPDASEAEIINCAKQAQCDFINKLEQGIHTNVGDLGTKLSGGERQRVTLARAMLKNAPIIVLDEATAFTDPENEHQLELAISGVVKGKTLITIAHKLPSIMNYDQICVMDQGKLVGSGRHDDLLQNCKKYQSLWKANVESAVWGVTNKGGVKNA